MSRVWLVLAGLLVGGEVAAQSPTPGGQPPPPGMGLAESAARRFPQPVRAGDLVGRAVLRLVEGQDRLGTVRAVVRDAAGGVLVEMELGGWLGGWLGFGGRRIAVPLDAMVLLGDVMEVAAFTPEQLRGFPTVPPGGGVPVPADTVLRVGLAKPSH